MLVPGDGEVNKAVYAVLKHSQIDLRGDSSTVRVEWMSTARGTKGRNKCCCTEWKSIGTVCQWHI